MDIADLPHAILRVVSVNEIGFDQKCNPDGSPTLDDPIKLRLGAYAGERNQFYIGTISFDVLRLDGQGLPHRTEVGFLKFAIDETVDHDKDPVPMVELFLTTNLRDSTDAAMQRVFTASRKGVVFHVPAIMNAGSAQGALPPARVTRFYSDDGQFCYNVQGDRGGHLVK